jgi:hypothetical protein
MSERVVLRGGSISGTFGSMQRWFKADPHRWMTPSIIAVVLLVSFVLGARVSPDDISTILIGLAGIGLVLVLLRWMPLGLFLLIFAAMYLDIEVRTGSNTSPNIAVFLVPILIAIWVVDMLVRPRRIRIIPSRVFVPLIGFVIVCLLAFGFGQLPWFVFSSAAPLRSQFAGLAIYLLSAGVFVLAAHLLTEQKWLERLTWFFLAVVGVYMLIAMIPAVARVVMPALPLGNSGSLLWIWLVTLAFSQALLNRRLHPGWRVLLFGLTAVTFYLAMVVNNDWKSGWIPPLIAVGVIIWLWSPRLGLLLTLIAAIIFWDLPFQLVASDQYSFDTRIAAWQIVLGQIVQVNPILGIGFANYRFYARQFSILGYYIQFNSHNNYVDIIAQIGFVGLAFFLWFAWELGRLGWRLRSQVPEGFPKAYVAGALAGLVATLVAGMLGDWVLPFIYNIGLNGMRASLLGWIFLGGLVALGQIYLQKKQDS